MTYKIVCKCGSEFTFASADESPAIQKVAVKEADKWRAMHHACCDTIEIEEALPEDWKL